MGGTTSTTKPTDVKIPDELKPLVEMAVAGAIDAQKQLPLTAFTGSNPQQIPNLSGQEVALINQAAGIPAQMEGALTGRPPVLPPPTPTLPMWQSQAPQTWRPPPPPPPRAPSEPVVTVDPNTGNIIVIPGQGAPGPHNDAP